MKERKWELSDILLIAGVTILSIFLSKYFLNPFKSSNFVLENFLEQEFNKKILKNFTKIRTRKLKLKNKTLSYQVF